MDSRKEGLQALVYNEFQARLDQSEILPKKRSRDEKKEDEEEKEKEERQEGGRKGRGKKRLQGGVTKTTTNEKKFNARE